MPPFLRLKIVCIGLEQNEDDPQIVFESINGTGVRLDGVDLIRNYLMMDKDPATQDELYKKYWQPIEDALTKESVIKSFIEHYLRIYDGLDVSKDAFYSMFKAHSKKRFKKDIVGLMHDICEYAKIYKVFVDKEFRFATPNATLQQKEILKYKIELITKLKFGVSYPFIMRIARDFEEDRLDFENFNSILEILISYHVRRQVCEMQSNALNKVMYVLYDEIKDSVSAESLKMALGSKIGKEMFPDDERIKSKFGECDAYTLNACKLILSEIEKSFYGKHSEKYPNLETCTIEHFYPQTPTEEWRKLVGDEYELLENMHIDTFGNLSLSIQNPKLGNKPFEEKLTIINELDGDKLYLNEYFTNQDTWGIAEIQERSVYLADRFCKVDIFRDLPKECRQKTIPLTLDDNLTHHRFSEVKFPTGRARVKTALELAKAVIDYLYQNHREKFEKYLDDAPACIEWNSAKAKTRDKNGSVSLEYKNGGFYFVSNASLESVGSALKKLIKGCGLNPQSFIVE